MADVEISYKGATIATMDDSGTKSLLTKSTWCEDDITIQYTKSGGGGATTVTFGDDAVFISGTIIGYVDGNGAFQHDTTLAVMSEVSYQMLSGSMLVWCSRQDPSMSGEIMGTITGMSLAYSTSFGSGFNTLYFRFYLVD